MKAVTAYRPDATVAAGPLPEFRLARKTFSNEECDALLGAASSRTRFYRSASASLARRVYIRYLDYQSEPWLTRRLEALARANNVWRLRLRGIADPIRIQRYVRNDYSDVHSDFDYPSTDFSKLTVVVPLVDRSDWKGGELQIGNSGAAPRLRRGDAAIFPSFLPHAVSRVTSGVRITMSAWVSGPALR